MKMNVKRGLITGGLVTTLFFLSSSLTAYGSQNAVLSAINIEGQGNSFSITLKTDKDINVETKVESGNRLIIELDDTKAAALMQTSFNKARNIEDVIVQPAGKNRTRLFISGNNVASSKIIIDSTKSVADADKFAQEEVFTTKKIPAINKKLENQIAQQETVSAEEFITQNTETIPADIGAEPTGEIIETVQPEVSTVTTHSEETTGIDSPPPVSDEESILEDDTIASETTEEDLTASSELFKPAADLEVPATGSTTTINNSRDSAAVATSKSLTVANNADPFPLSNAELIRFGIIFTFITILIGYLRKEKFFFAKDRRKKPAVSHEHLDIYRSLHNKQSLQKTGNKITPSISTLDSVTSRKKPSQPAVSTRKTTRTKGSDLNSKSLRQYSAAKSYGSNLKSSGSNKNLAQLSQNGIASRARALSGDYNNNVRKQPQTNLEFLRSMADLYEKSGRHDLAAGIQKSIRKSMAKT